MALVGEAAKLYQQKFSSDVRIEDEDVFTAWSSVAEGNSDNWLLCCYDGPSKNRVKLHTKGADGFAGLRGALTEDDVYYGVFRVSTAEGRMKTVFVCYIGENVGGMKKGRVSMHKNDIYNMFQGVVGEISASDMDELADSAVMEKVTKLIGGPVTM